MVEQSLNRLNIGDTVMLGGVIVAKKEKMTKRKEMMAFITIEDMYGSIDVTVFPRTYEKYKHMLFEENIILVKGTISQERDGAAVLNCRDLYELDDSRLKRTVQKLYLKVYDDIESEKMKPLLALLNYFNGSTPVYIYKDGDATAKKLANSYSVAINDFLMDELKQKLGQDNVKLVIKTV